MAPRSTNTILLVYKSIIEKLHPFPIPLALTVIDLLLALVALASILSIAAADVLIQGALYHLKYIVQDSDYILCT